MAKKKRKSRCTFYTLLGASGNGRGSHVGGARSMKAALTKGRSYSKIHGTGAEIFCDGGSLKKARRTSRRRVAECYRGTCKRV